MKMNEVAGIGNWNTAQFREYSTRTTRRFNRDPKYSFRESPFAVDGGNPIYHKDPLGDYKTRFGATFAAILHGGHNIKQNNDSKSKHYKEWSYNKNKSDKNGVTVTPDRYSNSDEKRVNKHLGLEGPFSDTRIEDVVDAGVDKVNKGLTKAWHSPLARMIVPDRISFGISGDAAYFVGGGVSATNITLITRGDPGLYLTPTVNGSLGDGMKVEGSLTFSMGWFMGDSRNIRREMLTGHTFGGNVGITVLGGGSVGASYSPLDLNNPSKGGFINLNINLSGG